MHPRAGLAPLELALSLPIMLFVMGLMIIAGTTAAWKARTVTTSRQAVWRTLWPRTGADDPNPRGWPPNASMQVSDGEAFMDFDPYDRHEVVRGQPLRAPSGEWMEVREELFEIRDEVRIGVSAIERDYPVMGNMPPGGINLRREHPILADRWQFQEMGIASNRHRRILFLYSEDLEPRMRGEVERYHNAALALLFNEDNQILDMLDRNPELPHPTPGGTRYEPPYGISRSPDYHFPERYPRGLLFNPDRVCSYDPTILQSQVGGPMVPEIQGRLDARSLSDAGVPGRLTRDYLRMYRTHVRHIENLLELMEEPTTPPEIVRYLRSREGLMRANLRDLETRIEQLEEFESTIVSGR